MQTFKQKGDFDGKSKDAPHLKVAKNALGKAGLLCRLLSKLRYSVSADAQLNYKLNLCD